MNFQGIGSSIVMRKTDYYNPSNPPMVSNKRLFSKIGGLGPMNVGSDEWVRAKEKQDRIALYNSQRGSGGSMSSPQKYNPLGS